MDKRKHTLNPESGTKNPLIVCVLKAQIFLPEFLVGMREVLAAKITTVLPTDNDLRGTAIALSRLRKVYKLHIRDLVQGRLLDTVSSVSKCAQ